LNFAASDKFPQHISFKALWVKILYVGRPGFNISLLAYNSTTKLLCKLKKLIKKQKNTFFFKNERFFTKKSKI